MPQEVRRRHRRIHHRRRRPQEDRPRGDNREVWTPVASSGWVAAVLTKLLFLLRDPKAFIFLH